MPLYGAHVGVGDGHDDEERRRLRVRREELPSVDDPLVAVAHGARREHRRVGAGLRLGHRVAGEQLAVEQRLQVALLLLGGAVVGDDLGVAGVGRLAAEDDRRPRRPAEDLVQQRELELAVALARRARGRGAWPTAPGRGPRSFSGSTILRSVSSERRELEPGPQRGRAARPPRGRTASAQSSCSWNSARSRSPMPSPHPTGAGEAGFRSGERRPYSCLVRRLQSGRCGTTSDCSSTVISFPPRGPAPSRR